MKFRSSGRENLENSAIGLYGPYNLTTNNTELELFRNAEDMLVGGIVTAK